MGIAGSKNIFFHKNPFFRITSFLIAGILISFYVNSFVTGVILLSVCLLVFIIVSLSDTYHAIKFPWIPGFSLLLLFFSIGFFLVQQKKHVLNTPIPNGKNIYAGEIVEGPDEKTNTYVFTVKIIASESHLKEHHILAYISKSDSSKELSIGDRILFNSVLQPPQHTGNPNQFDYASYLYKKGIRATTFISTNAWDKLPHKNGFSIRRLSQHIQHTLLAIYRQYGIENDSYGIAAAITLGYKDDLTPEVKERFSKTGAMHILAVSGLHVGIVFFIFNLLLSPLGKKKSTGQLRFALTLLFLWAYAFITGLSPSVVRATIMFSFVALGVSLKRNSSIYNTIAISAFVMLIYNPFYVFDVGFQLSYSAVSGIVFLEPKLEKLYSPNNRFTSYCWSLICVSIAAQLATLPFCLYYFHQFPNYFLLTNLLVIILTSVIIYVSIALLALSFIPLLANIIACLLNLLISFLHAIILFISELPYAYTNNIWISASEALLLTLIILSIATFVFHKKNYLLHVGIGCMCLLFFSFIIDNYKQLNTRKIIVYHTQNETTIQLTEKRLSNVIFSNKAVAERTVGNTIQKEKLTTVFNPLAFQLIHFGTKKICITEKNTFQQELFLPEREPVDYLISNNLSLNEIRHYLNFLSPELIIINNVEKKQELNQIESYCNSINMPCFSIPNEGAFVFTEMN